ncbi:MAG TPA: Nramp family divalent metal transporter [Vicinamibacterales bacterium]|nr:Nramp family divalent metal transporter [Vicinamibacterales bacterium]
MASVVGLDHLPAREVRELPEPPSNYWRLVGPGIVAGGVGLSSGEFVLWPYIASQVGLVLLWGAVVGVVTQFFINMEVERYTLATGETVLTGFNRFWRHWGLLFAVMGYFANLWPGWAISSATLTSYLVGGNPTTIGVVTLLIIGISLTFAPVVYVALERLIFVKVAAVLVLVVLATAFAIRPESWSALPEGFAHIGSLPAGLGIALIFSAIAFAGSGGAQNLCQSNWIRDKGFAMGQYVPRLVSPVTGAPQAKETATSYIFEMSAANLTRWRSWWRFANLEQVFSFVVVTIVTIGLTSLLAHSTVFGQPDLPNNVSFLRIEAEQLQRTVGPWFGVLFLAVGAFALFGSAMGIIDYTSRLAADIVKTTYLPQVSESRAYFWLVWGMVGLGCMILLAGLSQPITLLVISASTGGTMMFLYSFMLIALNRRMLPGAIRIGRFRTAALIWSTLMFGSLAVLTVYTQVQTLLR